MLASRKNELTVVAQDRNWRSYVSNELRCADQWAGDWGFLGANSDGKFQSYDPSDLLLKKTNNAEGSFKLLRLQLMMRNFVC